jgi:DNA-binding transcriptional ArsR family regulator
LARSRTPLAAEFSSGSDAGISELAQAFDITLTGIKKHVGVLESAGLVTTEKIGRVRRCRLGPRRLDDETAWIATYRRLLEGRLNRLGDFLERTREKRVTTSLFMTAEDRDGMLQSGMEGGLNESYAALDRLLATLR